MRIRKSGKVNRARNAHYIAEINTYRLKFVDSCIIVQFIKKSNKMQQCIKLLLFHIYMKFNMFQATHRP